MSSPDSILRALQEGDQACPDGRFLASLGAAARDAGRPPNPVDLVSRVREACAGRIDAQADDDGLIDEIYDGGSSAAAAADPMLLRLRDAVRAASRLPREPDLLPRVQDGLDGGRSRRLAAELDGHSRWRLWTAVVAGHVAALLTLAVFNVKLEQRQPLPVTIPGYYRAPVNYDLGGAKLPNGLPRPQTWSELAAHPQDLFALRQDQELRHTARAYYGFEQSAGVVRSGSAWLIEQFDVQAGTIGPLSGEKDIDLAVQSLALLAVLGEGVSDPYRRTVATRTAQWLANRQSDMAEAEVTAEATAAGLSALALVEAAVQLDNSDLVTAAREALGQLAEDDRRGHGGAWALLAAETARTFGWSVSDQLVASMMDINRDILAVQITSGVHDAMGAVASLSGNPPAQALDGASDLLAWWAPSLAMREVGGRLWSEWSQQLLYTTLPLFEHDGSRDLSWVPANRVRHAAVAQQAGDVFATSLAILNLQVPYRYLPLAP